MATGKSLLYIPEGDCVADNPLPTEIPIARRGLSVPGCPIGPLDFCDESFRSRVDKIQSSLSALRDLEDSQLETTLLRSCLALPKVNFTLRACPPSHIGETAKVFDSTIRGALEGIVGGPISDWSWQKASLPCSKGGLGLRSAVKHAPAAFLDSSLRSRPLVERLVGSTPPVSQHINSSVADIASFADRPDWVCLEDVDVPLLQKALSAAIDEASHLHLISSSPSTRFRALALSTSLPHAFDWLNVVPSPSLGLHLLDREFRCCISYWIGVPLHNSQLKCPVCNAPADPFGMDN